MPLLVQIVGKTGTIESGFAFIVRSFTSQGGFFMPDFATAFGLITDFAMDFAPLIAVGVVVSGAAYFFRRMTGAGR